MVFSREFQNPPPKKVGNPEQLSSPCYTGSAMMDLSINNVRARILTAGDMWWDLSNPQYEVPKGSGNHSLFAGSLWLGGIDASGQLHLASMSYRQSGTDFWPGPLDTISASTDGAVCDRYDKLFKIKRTEVEKFVSDFNSNSLTYIPPSILNWPGNGNPAFNHTKYLAPFHDRNGDGIYNPYDGDYPDFDLTGERRCQAGLKGDELIWWVFNDKGNFHSESGSLAMGMEIHAQAFAFSTGDEINNATFYNYKIINRSTYQLSDFYFGQWVDSDLGKYNDDYVGCNVELGLGYCYNGDNQDGNGDPGTYGDYLPAVGIDFLSGPLADLNDFVDNDRDCLVDEPGERFAMSKFLYYSGSFSVTGNPGNGVETYLYMTGRWKDGLRMSYGGNAYNTGGPFCDFMFPGSSDQTYSWGTGGTCQNPVTIQPPWDESTSGNIPADRRFIQSCGPFTMKPGAVNSITLGAI